MDGNMALPVNSSALAGQQLHPRQRHWLFRVNKSQEPALEHASNGVLFVFAAF
jgi:hypothetical protein